MQANFDARTAAAGTLSAPMERHQPEARKDRWMLELERAAMAGNAARAPHAAAQGEAAQAQAQSQADADAGQPHAASAPSSSSAPRHAKGAPQSGVNGAAAAGAPQLGMHGAAAWHGAPAGTGAATSLEWAVALAGAGLAPAAGGQGAATAPVPLSAMPAAGLQLALAANAPPLDAMPDADAGDAAAPDAPAPTPAPPDAEDYARSLLHLYSAEDGVHAWLRDASLSQAQVRRVASAMAGELALAGAPLAALTVNGRRILSPGAAGDQPGRRAADQPGAAAQPQVAPVAPKGA